MKRTGIGSILTNAVLLILGGALIYGNTFNRDLGIKIGDMMATPFGSLMLGGVMIAAVILGWVARFVGKKEKFIDFQSDGGCVGISTKAIKDFIERVGKEFGSVKSIDSRLNHNKGGVDIVIRVKVLSGTKIPELTQELQQRVRERVRESLGIDGIGNITVKVAEIVGEPTRKTADTPPVEG
ncbi:alkaline shock response membrane anchor protein AmaP [Pontiella agarivorans]|uniref:Alkaline shock response membrane anchor protein AmaP n=1 Tax=Pontiella agarivorans TaxID=3038953 RepID=A0ABU5MZA5_9BACT|nr:alkaline shock response membrane anchor protein AmaP [Pontiella agarivorans]MDZ8119544.1 alkaline shock response membrane anchor protein AmaP [Pontiella agarivorans]